MKGLISCVPRSLLHEAADALEVQSMRIFFFEFANNTIIERNICGDAGCWKDVDIRKLRRDYSKRGDYSFFKIRHTTLEGKYILIGYIGVFKNQLLPNEKRCMDLLGMIYGNYISRRITRDQIERSNMILPQLFASMSSQNQSGSIIFDTLKGFKKLMRFYRGHYFTIDGNNLYPEYLVARKIEVILSNKPYLKPITLSSQMYKVICGMTSKTPQMDVDDLPMLLQNLICKKEERERSNFICYFYPVFIDNEAVGLWLFAFHRNQINDFVNTKEILQNVYLLLRFHYKILFQRRSKKMIVNPIFRERDTRLKEKDVFIIMPFTQSWSDSVWQHAIKPTVESLELNPIRADDLYGENIMEDVWSGILQSSIIIADITGRNANVFYELGIAHTLGKKVILLTQDVKDIPFDLNVYRHIVYKTDFAGGDALKERLKNSIVECMSSKV